MAGKIVADTLEHSTAGSVDTQYVVNGSSKQWCAVNQTGFTVNDSFNTASVTDNGTGDMNPNFTSNMGGANNYAIALCCGDGGARFHGDVVNAAAVTTSTYRTYWVNTTNASVNDNDIATTTVHGDLA